MTFRRYIPSFMNHSPPIGNITQKKPFENLKVYNKYWNKVNPSFTIRTLGSSELKQLEEIKYVNIDWYGCTPKDFPHDRFLKTEYILTKWGSGFDIFDAGKYFRVMGIDIIESSRYRSYRNHLQQIKRNTYY